MLGLRVPLSVNGPTKSNGILFPGLRTIVCACLVRDATESQESDSAGRIHFVSREPRSVLIRGRFLTKGEPVSWSNNACVRVILSGTMLVLSAVTSSAQVERYKEESVFLARLAELGLEVLGEGFESSAWEGTRSPDPFDPLMMSEVLSQDVLWDSAAKDVFGDTWSTRPHGLSTNHNWARSGVWGLFENHSGEAYPTTIRVSVPAVIYAVGGWFNTNPDGQSVGFLFEGRMTANEPGYVLPGIGAMYPGDNPSYGHDFVGIVDPEGFGSVVLTGTLEINEKGVLEGGIIYGCDDFFIGVAPGFGGCGNPSDLAPPAGVLDLADVNAFVSAFLAQDSSADFDGNGVFDLADIVAFTSGFTAGCP